MPLQVRKHFASRAEAEAWVKVYFEFWPPLGYGTTATYHDHDDGSCTVVTDRWASCD